MWRGSGITVQRFVFQCCLVVVYQKLGYSPCENLAGINYEKWRNLFSGTSTVFNQK
jgi:hypothetical protein